MYGTTPLPQPQPHTEASALFAGNGQQQAWVLLVWDSGFAVQCCGLSVPLDNQQVKDVT